MSSPPSSSIYCHGDLLHIVQSSRLFNDCKTFVDMPTKYHPTKVTADFEKLYNESKREPTVDQLKAFINDHFHEPGQELEQYFPPDWTPSPSIVSGLRQGTMKEWASQLNALWKQLGRKVKDKDKDSHAVTSLIYVPHPFIVPGDRFREFYYWDSYWVISGLLLCDMVDTVKGMIRNFLSMVEQYGFVPNGGRIYYTNRSQPPFLMLMVHRYYECCKDKEFVLESLPILEKEYQFWMTSRTVQITRGSVTYKLNRYKADLTGPRPEGYKHDVELAQGLNKDDARMIYQNIASACESGWDFSTRWFRDYTNMSSICTQDIVPVDLNAILARSENILESFCRMKGDTEKVSYYHDQYTSRCEAIHKLMWNNDQGTWFDLDLSDGASQRPAYYISNFVPLFAKCYPLADKKHVVNKSMEYIQKHVLADYPGGVPTSLTLHQGQQWDFPNAWPPNVHMLIAGLHDSNEAKAVEMATDLTRVWLSSNYKAWGQCSAMMEKYNCEASGAPGGGGEYDLQTGFGWTNGVVLMLLDTFGDAISIE